jgi:hypothetical protein
LSESTGVTCHLKLKRRVDLVPVLVEDYEILAIVPRAAAVFQRLSDAAGLATDGA